MSGSHSTPTLNRAAPTFDFRIGAIDVSLECDLDEVLDDFVEMYGDCDQLPRDRTPIHMVVKRQKRSRLGAKRYGIFGDGSQVFEGRRRDEVRPYIEWGINRRVVARYGQYLQLHAASLVRNGRAVIFPGNSGAGKSTLSAGLMARGWTYLCDEFALINPKTKCVHPFPKALCIKSGSFGVVEKLRLPLSRRHYIPQIKNHVGYVRPPNGGGYAGVPAPVRFAVFPYYSGETRPRITPMRRAEAAFVLAGCAMNREVFGPDLPSLLGSLIRGVTCCWLECGAIEETCDLLESLTTSPPRLPMD